MIERAILDAFNDCIDRLATGQPLEAVLRLYPQHAGQLSVMLRIASLARMAVELPANEVNAARERVRLAVLEALAAAPPVAPPLRLLPRARRLLAAAAVVLIVGFIGALLLFNRQQQFAVIESLTPPSATPSDTPTFSATPEPSFTGTPSPTGTASATASSTASATASLTPTITLTQTQTLSPTLTRTASATRTPTASRTPTRTPTTSGAMLPVTVTQTDEPQASTAAPGGGMGRLPGSFRRYTLPAGGRDRHDDAGADSRQLYRESEPAGRWNRAVPAPHARRNAGAGRRSDSAGRPDVGR